MLSGEILDIYQGNKKRCFFNVLYSGTLTRTPELWIHKDWFEMKLKKLTGFFVISNYWVGFWFSYLFYLNMWLLKPSKNFDQIVIMRWINQAFTLGPRIWVRLINIKREHNSQSFYSKCWKKTKKGWFEKMYEHSKWYPEDFKLDFESIKT